jgi:hypothetical protein
MVWPWALGAIVGVLGLVVLWLSLATSMPQRRPRSYGFLLGTLVMAAAFAVAVLPLAFDTDEESGSPSAMLVTATLGYVAAIAATIRRRTRRVGQGMLIGLTVLLPLTYAGLVAANLGIIT